MPLYIANVKLILNRGHLKVFPNQGEKSIVELGPDDEADGVNIGNLIKNGAITPYTPPKKKTKKVTNGENISE